MNLEDVPTPPTPFPPSTEDQLGKLCRAQAKMIQSLRDDLACTHRANAKLSEELTEANDARAQALVSLQHAVTQGRTLSHRLVHERDTVLAALRSLVGHLKNQPITSLTYFGGAEFERSAREAIELLTLIDQLQKQQAKQDAKSG